MITERELVGRCLSGDRAAFDEIVSRYQDSLFRHLLRLSGSYEQAEDLSQDAFVRFYRALPSFDGARTIAPFLFKIATNLWRDGRRSRLTLVGEEEMEFLAAPRQPDQDALDHLERQTILRALRGLKQEYREAISLRYDQGLSYREIGEIMEAPPGTVATWLSRGLEALRQSLGVSVKEAAR
jgi:RNA polymerase sigma-70 factor (ECF subfamily)